MDERLQEIFFNLGEEDSSYVRAAVAATRVYKHRRTDDYVVGWSIGAAARSYRQAIEETRIEMTRIVELLDGRDKELPGDIPAYLMKIMRNYWAKAMRVEALQDDRDSMKSEAGRTGRKRMSSAELPDHLSVDPLEPLPTRVAFEKLLGSLFTDVEFQLIVSAFKEESHRDSLSRNIAVGRLRRHLSSPLSRLPATFGKADHTIQPWPGALPATFNRRRWRLLMKLVTQRKRKAMAAHP